MPTKLGQHVSSERLSLLRLATRVSQLALLAAAVGVLSACQDTTDSLATTDRAYQPLSSKILKLMAEKGTNERAPMLIRAYKKEALLQVWKMKDDGHYTLLKTYPMCRWSGQLGPKKREGDMQVPEGFYSIAPAQMNPNSAYYLSFNVGYPNAYDRAHGYTGSDIMVHGVCSSAGCFSMTDKAIAEIYAIAREAFGGGQRDIQMESLPFRMTAENLAKYRLDPNIAFWKELKKGVDTFDVTKEEPKVGVCGKHYVFNETPVDPHAHLIPTAACPPLKPDDPVVAKEVAKKEAKDNAAVAALVAKGVKPIRTVYVDGGQNPVFSGEQNLDVSDPDALAKGPVNVVLGPNGKPLPTVTASAKPSGKTVASVKAKPKSGLPSAVAASAPQPNSSAQQVSSVQQGVPFYTKWFAFLSGQTAPAAPSVPVFEPATPQPADVPLPPRRHTASMLHHKPAQTRSAPTAELRRRGKSDATKVATAEP